MNKLTNFENTLSELKNYLSTPIQDNRDRAGVIQAFEFTFEQSWKAIQKLAAEQGLELASPKAAFGFAMQNKWINPSSEQDWLALIRDRNLTSHTYERHLAEKVVERIQNQYLKMFENLLSALKNENK